MNSKQEKIVARLQNNMYTIRQLAGWNADELAEMLDVTKQTIYNLERGKPKMSWIQYLAIRAIIEHEIQKHPENEVLPKAVAVLLDNEDLPQEELNELQEYLKTIAKGMSRKTDIDTSRKLALKTIAAATAGIAAGVITKSPLTAIDTWLQLYDAFGEKDNQKGSDHGKKK